MSDSTKRPPATVVMTATLRPPSDCPSLVRSAPRTRLNDYLSAFRFYLGLPSEVVSRVALIDNSDTDLSEFQSIANTSSDGKDIRLISFQGNEHPPEFGKGFGEFRLLDYGVNQLNLKPDERLWKVTGRLQVTNLPNLIAAAPSSYDVYCDLRLIPFIGDRLGGNRWMDLRVFSTTVQAYDELFRNRYRYLRQRNSTSPEQHLFRVVRRARNTHAVFPRFKMQPIIAGYSGTSGKDYRSPEYQRKEQVRRIGRRIAPWLWL